MKLLKGQSDGNHEKAFSALKKCGPIEAGIHAEPGEHGNQFSALKKCGPIEAGHAELAGNTPSKFSALKKCGPIEAANSFLLPAWVGTVLRTKKVRPH